MPAGSVGGTLRPLALTDVLQRSGDMTLVNVNRDRNMLGGRRTPNTSPMVTAMNNGWRLNPSPSSKLLLGRCIHVGLGISDTLAIMHFVSYQTAVLTTVSEDTPHLATDISNQHKMQISRSCLSVVALNCCSGVRT